MNFGITMALIFGLILLPSMILIKMKYMNIQKEKMTEAKNKFVNDLEKKLDKKSLSEKDKAERLVRAERYYEDYYFSNKHKTSDLSAALLAITFVPATFDMDHSNTFDSNSSTSTDSSSHDTTTHDGSNFSNIDTFGGGGGDTGGGFF